MTPNALNPLLSLLHFSELLANVGFVSRRARRYKVIHCVFAASKIGTVTAVLSLIVRQKRKGPPRKLSV
jgi:hypothetical protein